MRLDIACGQRKQKGFKGIDRAGDADIVHDLNEFPWPIKTSSVTEVFCSHYAEHIPHWRPNFEKDGWFHFFEEVHRICKPGAKVLLFHPHNRNDRAFWDPTHTRFIHPTTYWYLNKEWREAQGLDHYDTDVDFEIVVMAYDGVHPNIAQRNAEHQAVAGEHQFNVYGDMQVELKVLKKKAAKKTTGTEGGEFDAP